MDVEAILDAELEEEEEMEEDEEEAEDEALERIKMEMTDRYEEEIAKIAVVQVCHFFHISVFFFLLVRHKI